VNQEDSEQNAVDGMKKGAELLACEYKPKYTNTLIHFFKANWKAEQLN